MYQKIKNLVKGIIPKRVLFKAEPWLRPLLYQFYRGNNFQCNICNKQLRRFISLGEDKLCPYCGSLSRTRRLWDILYAQFLEKGSVILDFSPARCVYRGLKKNTSIHYVGSDLSGDFLSDVRFDITNIDVESNKFDVIICYHVLEHIENDSQAMKELYRVLREGGSCIVQTPFKEGDIYENPAINDGAGRLKHFGQKDHVRIYSVNGLKERLIKSGFQVTIQEFTEEENNRFGFRTKEVVIFGSK
ncbi:MAG TPA: methyltransferase domain-containing protein [Bacteroidales bacterium]